MHHSQIKTCFSNIACGLKYFYNADSLKLHFRTPLQPQIQSYSSSCGPLLSPKLSWEVITTASCQVLCQWPKTTLLFFWPSSIISEYVSFAALTACPVVPYSHKAEGAFGSCLILSHSSTQKDNKCLICWEKTISTAFPESLLHCLLSFKLESFFLIFQWNLHCCSFNLVLSSTNTERKSNSFIIFSSLPCAWKQLSCPFSDAWSYYLISFMSLQLILIFSKGDSICFCCFWIQLQVSLDFRICLCAQELVDPAEIKIKCCCNYSM